MTDHRDPSHDPMTCDDPWAFGCVVKRRQKESLRAIIAKKLWPAAEGGPDAGPNAN